MFLMPVLIYEAKKYHDIWLEQKLDYKRLWFVIEIDFYFRFLFSIVVFLQLTYWTKASTMSKNTADMLDDDNIWNDKNTEDHLRFVKRETFDLSLQITFLIWVIGFTFFESESLDVYGPREFEAVGIMCILLIAQHATHIVADLYKMYNGQKRDLVIKVTLI